MLKGILQRFDWLLIVPTVFLTGIGLAVLFSINLKSQALLVDFDVWSQVLFVAVGGVLAILVGRLDYHLWKSFSGWFYVLSLGLLTVVLFVDPVQGSSRWISLGFFQFQPSEIMKLALVVILA